MPKAVITYQFRIKDSNCRQSLRRIANSVNFVWNYCNETSLKYIQNRRKYLTGFDLNRLTVGCSDELGLFSDTIQSVCQQFAIKRKIAKKSKLAWRSHKRSLGWIPIKGRSIKIIDDTILYRDYVFKFWKSREFTGKIKTASLCEDSRGRWYLNVQCEIERPQLKRTGKEIGIDLGLKTIASDSEGNKYSRENLTRKYEDRLAMAQRAGKKKLAQSIHAKIKNCRKDWAHKNTTEIVSKNDFIVVGNVSSRKLKKTKMAKSVSDAGWYQFKSLLAYKAIRLGKDYVEVKENLSTVTCSVCLANNKANVGGLSNLGVREWTCSVCGTIHDRDTNAAKNILRFGHESLKGIHVEDVKPKQTQKFL